MAGLASDLSVNQASELLARLGRAGLTLERAKLLMADDTIVANWVSAFPVSMTVTNNMPTFKVTVDVNLDLAAMIKAGKYDWVYEEITDKKFPSTKKGTSEIDLVLVHLDRCATTKEVEAELDKRGLRAATIEELLALGAAQPELQRQFPIVALGSRCVLGAGEDVPVLDFSNGRELSLGYCDNGWDDYFRFLAVRK